jgi:hypothetical protein
MPTTAVTGLQLPSRLLPRTALPFRNLGSARPAAPGRTCAVLSSLRRSAPASALMGAPGVSDSGAPKPLPVAAAALAGEMAPLRPLRPP